MSQPESRTKVPEDHPFLVKADRRRQTRWTQIKTPSQQPRRYSITAVPQLKLIFQIIPSIENSGSKETLEEFQDKMLHSYPFRRFEISLLCKIM